MLGNVGGGENFFGGAYAVVFRKHDTDFSAHSVIVVDAFGNGVYKFDNRFCAPVARCRFCAEDKGAGGRVKVAFVDDSVVQINDV